MIDTHTHIFAEEFDADIAEVVKRAEEAGVTHMVCPAIDSESHERLFALARRYPEQCLPLIGLHPTSVNDNPYWRKELSLVEQYLSAPPEGIRWYGIGETGMDLYWSKDFQKEQEECFERQIKLSLQYSLPLSIHVREAWEPTLRILKRYAGTDIKGIMHAFSGTIEDYHEVKSCGDFMFGIGGVVTYKKSTMPEIVAQMSPDDIVLETDAPYLTPVPYRGKRNESAYLTYICAKIAEIRGLTTSETADATTANARRMFGIQE